MGAIEKPAEGAVLVRPASARGAWWFIAAVAACGLVYSAAPDSALSSVLVGLVALSGLVMVGVGTRLNRPPRAVVWRYLQVALTFSTVGAVIRNAVGQDVAGLLISDSVALCSYPLLFTWLLGMLRARDPNRQDAVADGILVAIAAFLMAWVLLVTPALALDDSPLLIRLMEVSFPVLDAVLLFMIVRLAFLTSFSVVTLRLLVAGFSLTLMGDLLWALTLVSGMVFDSRLLELPYLMIFGLAGGAALHPSMRVLTTPAREVIRPLPGVRLVAVSLAVATPALVVLLRPITALPDRAAVAISILGLAAVVLWRTIRAVNRHAVSEQRLAERATHDSLTGLPNRVRLVERLGEGLEGLADRPDRTVAVLFCDLDGFKFVNDSWGHPVGDELLLAAGERLQAIQRSDQLIARIGGDEFVVVCEWTDPETELPETARLVLAQFAEPFILSVGEVFVTASIGVALCQDPSGAADDLVRDADTAMYEAKSAGRNRWAIFDGSMRYASTRRLQTQVELRRALERDELVVHYQPIVRVSDGALRGFEALVRWDHPEHGLVGPSDFIPLIEDTDLILPLGELVLRRAAKQLISWQRQRAGEELHMAVNVAARQLRDPSFVDCVRSVLDETGCPPWTLTLEITESMMVEDSETSRGKLEALRALGIGLSVDDFGTGYSSLKYLKRFPVTTVKIDRSFVSGLGQNPEDEAIVEAVLAMSHALGLDVVAEGVETAAQREQLRALGCDSAQGYLFGRPASASAMSMTLPSAASATASPKVTA